MTSFEEIVRLREENERLKERNNFLIEEIAEVRELTPLKQLTKDLKEAAATLSPSQARYLVDMYYTLQEHRKASMNQSGALERSEEPHSVIDWLAENMTSLEGQVKKVLDYWGKQSQLGQWCNSITGIGPVITAGLLAHIDIEKAKTAGAIWKFAGLDPSVKWNKGEKRPWNAALKVLCWKIGESFVKVQNRESDVYGKLYAKKKQDYINKNSMGEYEQAAKGKLEAFNIGKTTDAYGWYSGQYPLGTAAAYSALEGDELRKKYLEKVRVEPGEGVPQLPPAHIQSRSKRYAVKLFLSHFHHVAWELRFKTPPPKPFAIDILNHTHYVAPPNYPMKQKAA